MFVLLSERIELDTHNIDYVVDRAYGPYEASEVKRKQKLLADKGIDTTIHELLDVY